MRFLMWPGFPCESLVNLPTGRISLVNNSPNCFIFSRLYKYIESKRESCEHLLKMRLVIRRGTNLSSGAHLMVSNSRAGWIRQISSQLENNRFSTRITFSNSSFGASKIGSGFRESSAKNSFAPSTTEVYSNPKKIGTTPDSFL
jgi:hypothetical protein